MPPTVVGIEYLSLNVFAISSWLIPLSDICLASCRKAFTSTSGAKPSEAFGFKLLKVKLGSNGYKLAVLTPLCLAIFTIMSASFFA